MEKSKNILFYTLSLFVGVLTLLAIVGVVAGLGVTTQFNNQANTITVQGTGEVFTAPDVAEFIFTVLEESPDVTVSQEQVTIKIAEVLGGLSSFVEEKDIKTQNYTSNPRYEWQVPTCAPNTSCVKQDRQRVLVGYEVSQTVMVKLRDLEDIPQTLTILGTADVANISGPHLRIEDTDALRIAAREEAIAKAQEEARMLASTLDVRLGKMVDFSENNFGGPEPFPMMARAMSMDFAMESGAEFAPEIPAGEDRVQSTVYMTFKIK